MGSVQRWDEEPWFLFSITACDHRRLITARHENHRTTTLRNAAVTFPIEKPSNMDGRRHKGQIPPSKPNAQASPRRAASLRDPRRTNPGGATTGAGRRRLRRLVKGAAQEAHLGVADVEDAEDVLHEDGAEDVGAGAARGDGGHAHAGEGVDEFAEDEVARVDGQRGAADVHGQLRRHGVAGRQVGAQPVRVNGWWLEGGVDGVGELCWWGGGEGRKVVRFEGWKEGVGWGRWGWKRWDKGVRAGRACGIRGWYGKEVAYSAGGTAS